MLGTTTKTISVPILVAIKVVLRRKDAQVSVLENLARASEEKSQEKRNNTEEEDIEPPRKTVTRSKQVSCFGPVNWKSQFLSKSSKYSFSINSKT